MKFLADLKAQIINLIEAVRYAMYREGPATDNHPIIKAEIKAIKVWVKENYGS